MLVAWFPAGALGTNCWVLAPAAGERCLVIDPGQGAAPGVAELVAEHRLRPAGVLITHGHLDHTWDAEQVCAAYGVPVYVGASDRPWLADPAGGLSADFASFIAGVAFREPADVRELKGGEELDELAGVGLLVEHTPGHTAGSICFSVRSDGETPSLLVTGDTLFEGAIGRTDLPTGSYPTIMRSLASLLQAHDDETAVLPGHGGLTTIGREREQNPYLADIAVR